MVSVGEEDTGREEHQWSRVQLMIMLEEEKYDVGSSGLERWVGWSRVGWGGVGSSRVGWGGLE